MECNNQRASGGRAARVSCDPPVSFLSGGEQRRFELDLLQALNGGLFEPTKNSNSNIKAEKYVNTVNPFAKPKSICFKFKVTIFGYQVICFMIVTVDVLLWICAVCVIYVSNYVCFLKAQNEFQWKLKVVSYPWFMFTSFSFSCISPAEENIKGQNIEWKNNKADIHIYIRCKVPWNISVTTRWQKTLASQLKAIDRMSKNNILSHLFSIRG